MKPMVLILSGFTLLASCDRKHEEIDVGGNGAMTSGEDGATPQNSGERFVDPKERIALTKEEVKSLEKEGLIDKVGIVREVEPFLDKAVSEGWPAEEWKQRFPDSWRERVIGGDILLLEYTDESRFETAYERYISGVSIRIIGGKTREWRWMFVYRGFVP